MRFTLHLVFVLHEPIGTRHNEMLRVAETVYEPLIDLLEAFDDEVRCGLYCSGSVLEWLDRHRRALADRIAALASSGTVEFLGGGFYAPLLPIIPWRDGVGQLEMTSGYLERRMGVRPTGVWLTDGVWEPRLAEMLADAGADWALVPEYVLHDAGMKTPVFGHYTTEHLGRPLMVVPIDERLGATLPTAQPARLLQKLQKRVRKWPDDAVLTWCGRPSQFGPGALEMLFQELAHASEWLDVQHVGETLAKTRPRATAYIRPTACMGRPLAQNHFIRYTEASWMHKRMIEVSRRFAAVERVLRNDGYKGLSKLTFPRRALYRGQSATIYEQGGTIYRPEVRDGVYRNLIECESETHSLIRGDAPFLETSLRDLFGDFETSVLLRNPTLRLVLQPHAGGRLAAFEHTPSRTAFHNVMTRRAESWHDKLPQPAQLDGHTRACLHDRFLDPDAPISSWMDDSGERGNLLDQRYRMLGLDQVGRGADERVVVAMAADALVEVGDTSVPVSILKRVGLGARDSHAAIDYQLEFAAPVSQPIDFAVELNLATLAWLGSVTVDVDTAGGLPREIEVSASAVGHRAVVVRHQGLGIWVVVQSDQTMTVERAPIETVDPVDPSDPGGPLMATMQGVAILLRRRVEPGERRLSWSMRLGVSPLSEEPPELGAVVVPTGV